MEHIPLQKYVYILKFILKFIFCMECMYLELHLDVSLLLHHKQCYYNLKTLPLHLLNSTSLSIAAIYLK